MLYDPASLDYAALSSADLALARRHAPVIRFATNEPFLPSHMGVTIVDRARRSPSCPYDLAPADGIARIIEYAIWWDWDIGHLYELEHVWVKLDADDNVVGVDASAHGHFRALQRPNGTLPMEAGRITLYSEPGKHAFHASREALLEKRRELRMACAEMAGNGTILVNEMFVHLFDFTPAQHRAVRRYLESRAFTPAFAFDRMVDTADLHILSWPDLHAHIAQRIPHLVAEIEASQPLIKAVLIDSGDTMIDESTEMFDEEGYVLSASLIPGALEMIETLAEEGYRLVLVADGRLRSFETVLGFHGIRQYLHAEIISEQLGTQKPAAKMFLAALAAAGLSQADARKVVMIGNHLERDIAGANRLGIVSIWQSWSDRRARVAASPDEVPDYMVRTPGEIAPLLRQIELLMDHTDRLAAVKMSPLRDKEPKGT